MRTVLVLLLCFFLSSCGVAPRVSTKTERDTANAILTLVETASTVANVTGKVTPEQWSKAQYDIAQLRMTIANSETTPVGWADVLNQVVSLAVLWIVPSPIPIVPK